MRQSPVGFAGFALLSALGFSGCSKEEPAPAGARSEALPKSSAKAAVSAEAPNPSLAILNGFEGNIGLRLSGKMSPAQGASTAPVSFALQVKDGKLRVELPADLAGDHGVGKVTLLVEPSAKRLYALLEAQKQAVLVEFDKLEEQVKRFGDGQGPLGAATKPEKPPEIKKTGKVDRVAGHSCEIWQLIHDTTKGELCVASAGAPWLNIPLAHATTNLAWAGELLDGKHFPLRFVGSENGAEAVRIEVTSIEKQALDEARFALPASYKVVSIDQMMQAMLQGMPGLPSGMRLPPGSQPSPLQLPPGVRLPPGVKLPPGMKLPSGVQLPPSSVMPPPATTPPISEKPEGKKAL